MMNLHSRLGDLTCRESQRAETIFADLYGEVNTENY